MKIGGEWQEIKAPVSTSEQMVCEILKDWSPELYEKAGREPSEKFDAAVAAMVEGVRLQVVKPTKVHDDKVWCIVKMPLTATKHFYRKNGAAGIFVRRFATRDQDKS